MPWLPSGPLGDLLMIQCCTGGHLFDLRVPWRRCRCHRAGGLWNESWQEIRPWRRTESSASCEWYVDGAHPPANLLVGHLVARFLAPWDWRLLVVVTEKSEATERQRKKG